MQEAKAGGHYGLYSFIGGASVSKLHIPNDEIETSSVIPPGTISNSPRSLLVITLDDN